MYTAEESMYAHACAHHTHMHAQTCMHARMRTREQTHTHIMYSIR